MDTQRKIHTSRAIKQRARDLRQAMTPAEKKLWDRLRNRQFLGMKFRRQHPLGPYIADFYCAEHRLIIELDGGIHISQEEADAKRTQQIIEHNYRVIRFNNEQVEHNFDAVLKTIAEECS